MKLSLDYIAGFFDGEGCIGVYGVDDNRVGRKYYTLHVSASNTRKQVILHLKNRFGGRYVTVAPYGYGHKQPMYLWQVSHLKARAFLEKIADRLVIKKKQAQIALKYCRFHFRENRQAYIDGKWVTKPDILTKEKSFSEQLKKLKRAA